MSHEICQPVMGTIFFKRVFDVAVRDMIDHCTDAECALESSGMTGDGVFDALALAVAERKGSIVSMLFECKQEVQGDSFEPSRFS